MKVTNLRAALVLVGITSGAVAVGATPASAHHPIVSATTITCLAPGATTWPVTLTITSDAPGRGKEYTADSPSGYTPTGWVSEATPLNRTVNVPVAQTSFTETVSVSWRVPFVGNADEDDFSEYKYGPTGVGGTTTAYKPELCPKEKIPVPAKPDQTDPCGVNNAAWNVPADTDKLDWTLTEDGRLVVSVKGNVEFEDKTTTKDFGQAVDSGTLCPKEKIPVPAKPDQTDPCGVNNATWNVPADTDKLDWNLGADGHLTVTTKGDVEFEDKTTTKDFGQAVDSGVICPVTDINVQAQPRMEDVCGIANDKLVLPGTTGVLWAVNGVTAPAGELAGAGSMKVTASAAAGYVLVGPNLWTFTFTNFACEHATL